MSAQNVNCAPKFLQNESFSAQKFELFDKKEFSDNFLTT